MSAQGVLMDVLAYAIIITAIVHIARKMDQLSDSGRFSKKNKTGRIGPKPSPKPPTDDA